ncbi:hypothetical protein [Dyella psychrodurans]|uniref:Uncharacterized protein n=1 Tax=Dyella psychrodurans TaxID=1927960 RepID=A0A370X4N3_9GAMM|nr:hypothetical protein [Dyella psychrodurans]RDS83379.1 hypothetical protein DWU99_12655 [Dyella psychrodurans]
MKALIASLLVLSTTMLLASCKDTQNVDAKLNPHPIPYEITLIIDGAPGPFDSVGGFMQYEVTNLDCVPETGGPFNPLRLSPKADPRIIFQKMSNNVYRGTVYVGYFQDEDYFGLGVCHWSLNAATVELKINKLTMVSYLDPEQLPAQKPVTTYFVREDYLNNDLERGSVGELGRTKYPPNRQDSIFSIALTPKDIAP